MFGLRITWFPDSWLLYGVNNAKVVGLSPAWAIYLRGWLMFLVDQFPLRIFCESVTEIRSSTWANLLLKQGHLQPRITPRQSLTISKERDSVTSLGNLQQCSVNVIVKKCSWCSGGTSCLSLCVHFLWFCHWAPLKSTWLFAFSLQVFT